MKRKKNMSRIVFDNKNYAFTLFLQYFNLTISKIVFVDGKNQTIQKL